jgi:hypothetical protein
MSTLYLPIQVKVAGTLTDADSTPILRDEANAYGVKRMDTAAIVVAAGTAMTRSETGRYYYALTNPVAGVTYRYAARVIVGGKTFWIVKDRTAASSVTLNAYLEADEARVLGAALPGLATLIAKDDATLAMLLSLASIKIDAAMRYQGRKYAADQVREFPRVAYGDNLDNTIVWANPGLQGIVPDVVWDWDSENSSAVVPQIVKVATLYQAASSLDASLASRLEAIRSGLKGQQIGTASETYATLAEMAAVGGLTGLCDEAHRLMERYRLRTGRIL